MSTSTKLAAFAAGCCLIAWVFKKLAYQRADDYPLSLVNLMRELELQQHTVPEPKASAPADNAATASEVEGNTKTSDTPTEPKPTTSQAAP